MARKALYGGALLYMFLGPEIFCVYFGNSLAEWVHHSAGFFLLSAVFQSFETPVTQDYLRVSHLLSTRWASLFYAFFQNEIPLTDTSMMAIPGRPPCRSSRCTLFLQRRAGQ